MVSFYEACDEQGIKDVLLRVSACMVVELINTSEPAHKEADEQANSNRSALNFSSADADFLSDQGKPITDIGMSFEVTLHRIGKDRDPG